MAGFRSAWMSTELSVNTHGRTIDLDHCLAGGLSAAVSPLIPPICIVTAWNPKGQEQPLEVNEAANLRMLADLDSQGLQWLPALGESIDHRWAEPGFAVAGLTEAGARDLGRRWAQLAVFYVTDEQIAVLGCEDDFRDTRPRGLPKRDLGCLDEKAT